MTFRILSPTEDHISSIAARMRPADVEELRVSTGRAPDEALRYSIGRSDMAFTVMFDGVPETIFGCGPSSYLSREGCPWLLGTDALERNYRHFLRGSIFWVRKMREEYTMLRNAVDDRNEISKRWLSWLGFELGDTVPMGYERMPFRIFEMKGLA